MTCICTEDICETDKGIHPPTKWRIAERLCEEMDKTSLGIGNHKKGK